MMGDSITSSVGKTTLSKHCSKMQQTTKTEHNNLSKPSLLLKDYLIRDDLMSSCSSNGFKSFPRRQCCSTVGLILMDKRDLDRKRRRKRSKSKNETLLLPCSSSKVSVLQRASKAVINAIKSSLPPLNGILSRSFLRSRSFWRKTVKKEESGGTQRWRTSFRELLMQDRHKTTSSFNEDSVVVSVFAAPSSNNSWGESEFTFSSSSAASSSESSAQNDVAQATKEVAQRHKIEEEPARDWATNEEKEEQFSPVSVLDCPFEDDEGIKPHFNSTTHSLLQGAEHNHKQKRRHFKSVESMEAVALEKRMSWSEMDNSTNKNSVLVPIKCTQNVSTNMPHYTIEESARDLLNLVKRSIPSNLLIIKAENLLFDYFKQSIVENNFDIHHNQSKKLLHLCKVAEDWINGQPQEVYLGDGRNVYIKEMDKCVEWRNTNREVQQLAMEMENEIFFSLINEIILDHLLFVL